ncbi:3-hydroxyacyl-CoA dehydrogenase NAD-binding domain-containing protein [Rhizobium grahamii]|uniref:3-hydroxyacyl-CoA dehydrogenase n=1 Tax=Rhizobium grahamii TaxID=1120045 RepID=A0A370KJL3_9HYPH|nr:3-hydroxyacyl-CoA dehydrogenase NAD-binding domain-containing protein [Rhizobium grahamii]RDJ06740.1 3-hydroxyacyl-CoA dehydrogenase [Rhizobium grahamii]
MTLTIKQSGNIAVVTVDNPPVNALSQALRQGLWSAAETLDSDPSVEAVVLICAGRTFIAGADVSEFGRPPLPPHLPDLVTRIEKAAKPWVAAVHGSALGGGFEVALGCRFRVATPSASVGLPEVRLGIVPGAGGTVRLPRLAGPALAADMITSGQPVRAVRAQEQGLIDAVVEDDLETSAIDFVRLALDRPLPPPLCERSVPVVDASFWETTAKTVAQRAKREEAPLRALDCVRKASEGGFEAAMRFERETFLDLRASPQAEALRHVFFAERAAPRPPELRATTPRQIRSAAVIGGGTMGAGIVAAFCDAELPVTLVERDSAALERGLSNLRSIFEGSVKRGKISSDVAEKRLSGVTATTDYGTLADVDLVIEAVFEDLDVKRDVFSRLSAVCRPDALLATNTSYLDPEQIAAGIKHPERFLGLHFFSPANVMKLLEIVPTRDTAAVTLATGFSLARMLNKIPVRAGICDGFIGNRILKVTRAQAERLLLSGVAPQAVDSAMRRFGLPMGPFEAQDLGGLDIAAFQRQAARKRGETPFAPVAERLCGLGRFGQKSGGGWYDYEKGDRTPKPSAAVERIIAAEAASTPQRKWREDEIIDCIVLPMINEATKILDETIAARAEDIDLVQIHGYGFPRFRGGLMHYAEKRGIGDVVAILEGFADEGLAEGPCDLLRRSVNSGRLGSP